MDDTPTPPPIISAHERVLAELSLAAIVDLVGRAKRGEEPYASKHDLLCELFVIKIEELGRLVRGPDPGIVLDPFCGSGTTGIAALMEGMDFVGHEQKAEYVDIARARMSHHDQA